MARVWCVSWLELVGRSGNLEGASGGGEDGCACTTSGACAGRVAYAGAGWVEGGKGGEMAANVVLGAQHLGDDGRDGGEGYEEEGGEG